MDDKLILVTGATGYIASRLIPRLLEKGYRVRCLARNPLRLNARSWYRQVEVVSGDIMNPSTLPAALEGVWTAYYLIHNMTAGDGYTHLELNGAKNFLSVAEQASVQHLVYLGGLANESETIAAHMRSRIDTGHILRRGKIPVTEFRAGVIVGSGSISFEMIRFMTELMPVICGPVWLQNLSQPIAVENIIDYLIAALNNKNAQGKIFEIGGPDVMSYANLMLTYGKLRGLQRKFVAIPGLPLWFMALGVELMTPVPAVIATPLVDGMRSSSVVHQDDARNDFPEIQLTGYEQAVTQALHQLHPRDLEPAWADCDLPSVSIKHQGFFVDYRCAQVDAPPEEVFERVASLGGEQGWLYADWLWKLRGWLDRLIGGPGMRGRSEQIVVGETLDFYRIDRIEEDRFLRLHSELKAPGEGWMEWRVGQDSGITKLTQISFFAPRGMPGFVYWYLLNPVHRLVFRGLIRKIAQPAAARGAKNVSQ